MQNSTEIIENPSQQKTAEAHSTESRGSTPGDPLRRGESKQVEFFAERMVYNRQQAVQTLSAAVQLTSNDHAGNQMQYRNSVDYTQSPFYADGRWFDSSRAHHRVSFPCAGYVALPILQSLPWVWSFSTRSSGFFSSPT